MTAETIIAIFEVLSCALILAIVIATYIDYRNIDKRERQNRKINKRLEKWRDKEFKKRQTYKRYS